MQTLLFQKSLFIALVVIAYVEESTNFWRTPSRPIRKVVPFLYGFHSGDDFSIDFTFDGLKLP